ncbi:MAG TPA: hypothetical protein VFM43_05455 [Gaiellaceae bacterium]|nr:hypothetical protein [Gaiellaceae bacterium]
MPHASATFSVVERVGHRGLRDGLNAFLGRSIHKGRIAVLTNRNEDECFLVPPERFEEMAEAEASLGLLKTTLPLLLTAARAGAAIPSETLDQLGIEIPFDWKALNLFQAHYPVTITHGQEGDALPVLATATPMMISEAEDDEEVVLPA